MEKNELDRLHTLICIRLFKNCGLYFKFKPAIAYALTSEEYEHKNKIVPVDIYNNLISAMSTLGYSDYTKIMFIMLCSKYVLYKCGFYNEDYVNGYKLKLPNYEKQFKGVYEKFISSIDCDTLINNIGLFKIKFFNK